MSCLLSHCINYIDCLELIVNCYGECLLMFKKRTECHTPYRVSVGNVHTSTFFAAEPIGG